MEGCRNVYIHHGSVSHFNVVWIHLRVLIIESVENKRKEKIFKPIGLLKKILHRDWSKFLGVGFPWGFYCIPLDGIPLFPYTVNPSVQTPCHLQWPYVVNGDSHCDVTFLQSKLRYFSFQFLRFRPVKSFFLSLLPFLYQNHNPVSNKREVGKCDEWVI